MTNSNARAFLFIFQMLTPVDPLPYQAYSSTIAPAIRSFLPRLVNDYPCLEVQPIIRI